MEVVLCIMNLVIARSFCLSELHESQAEDSKGDIDKIGPEVQTSPGRTLEQRTLARSDLSLLSVPPDMSGIIF